MLVTDANPLLSLLGMTNKHKLCKLHAQGNPLLESKHASHNTADLNAGPLQFSFLTSSPGSLKGTNPQSLGLNLLTVLIPLPCGVSRKCSEWFKRTVGFVSTSSKNTFATWAGKTFSICIETSAEQMCLFEYIKCTSILWRTVRAWDAQLIRSSARKAQKNNLGEATSSKFSCHSSP